MIRGLTALIFVLMAEPALAEVCDKVRPFWTAGSPATAWDEFLGLIGTVPSLGLVLATALALRFRSQWGGVAVVVLWTIWVSLLVFGRAGDEIHAQAVAEGCIGSPTLFILVIAAICAATIHFTAPRETRPHQGE